MDFQIPFENPQRKHLNGPHGCSLVLAQVLLVARVIATPIGKIRISEFASPFLRVASQIPIVLALNYDAKGMHAQAVDEYRLWTSIDGETTSILCYLGYALAMSGKRSEAEAILAKLKTTKEYVSPGELAVLYVGLGDKETALATLEKGYEAHDPEMQNLKVAPYYDPLRSDARFQTLLRRVGLSV